MPPCVRSKRNFFSKYTPGCKIVRFIFENRV
nr:MAG TPA: hypothetical protein [Caudoviricetes sp.]